MKLFVQNHEKFKEIASLIYDHVTKKHKISEKEFIYNYVSYLKDYEHLTRSEGDNFTIVLADPAINFDERIEVDPVTVNCPICKEELGVC